MAPSSDPSRQHGRAEAPSEMCLLSIQPTCGYCGKRDEACEKNEDEMQGRTRILTYQGGTTGLESRPVSGSHTHAAALDFAETAHLLMDNSSPHYGEFGE